MRRKNIKGNEAKEREREREREREIGQKSVESKYLAVFPYFTTE